MYFVDRSKIEETLVYINELLDEFSQHSYRSRMEKFGLERITHMLIESILDVGNMMIDGFVMRDPGSYEDIIDILVDEKVLPEQDQEGYKEIIQLRNTIVRDYLTIEHGVLNNAIANNKDRLSKFSIYVTKYLDNELGVAHAFSNK